MSTKIQCREKLTALLEAHTSKIAIANEYLTNIKNAIAENKLETLNQNISNPELPIQEIEQLDQQRHHLLNEFGFGEGIDGFEKCVAWCDNDVKQISELYQKLIQSLQQMQHSIQINNLLVNKGRDRIRRSIGILTGQGNDSNHKIYTSTGKAEHDNGQRAIAVA
jgi:flagellar biosynthesis/type III secretory pathway chaperone